jgi:hypothetical protein
VIATDLVEAKLEISIVLSEAGRTIEWNDEHCPNACFSIR